MQRRQHLLSKRYAPIELIKDHSLFRVRVTAWVMGGGHLLYYWVWAHLYPQPYENLVMRGLAVTASALLLVFSYRWSVNSLALELLYSVSVFFGSVFIATWFFVANDASTVWISSYCAIVAMYFTQTDWRIAIAGIVVSLALTAASLPFVHPEVWAGLSLDNFLGPTIFITGFALSASIFTHFMDKNIRAIQLGNQQRALGIAAHEVRTPLASIGVLSDALASRLGEVKSGQNMTATELLELRGLASEIERSVALTSNVINAHLVNANPMRQFDLRMPVQMSSAVQDAINLFVFMENVKEEVIDFQVGVDFQVAADPVIIQQIIRNLLDNAHTSILKRHQFAPTSSINVFVGMGGEDGIVVVKDRGIGISKRDLTRVFEPFHTTNEGAGHGLGLTFVRSAVLAYGGSIKALSEAQEGASFVIKLPILNPK